MILTMSSDDMRDLANKDTPSAVTVPATMTGLLTWAAGRFGGAALIAGALAYGMITVYTDMKIISAQQLGDMKAQNAVILELVRAQTSVNSEMATSLKELSRQVEALNSTRR